MRVAAKHLAFFFVSLAAAHSAFAQSYRSLPLRNGVEGGGPVAALIYTNGSFYGTTAGGGLSKEGSVFIVAPNGRRTVYSFTGPDGEYPKAALLAVGGMLYGTTSGGGSASGGGTVFKIDPATGDETVLHAFTGLSAGGDGAEPLAPLIYVDGELFGTTEAGGAQGTGTIFRVDPLTGAEKIVYSFAHAAPDGQHPYSALLKVGQLLYGTTELGGPRGGGTVFKFDPVSGQESIVYGFGATGDGIDPVAAVIDVNGSLFGTTLYGGGGSAGAVFELNLATGSERTLYSFGTTADRDGSEPDASLVYAGGLLYGTTPSGGAFLNGTVFSIDPVTGIESIVHSFAGPPTDGNVPEASLLALSGTLYGTTKNGGANNFGTVFGLTP